MQRVYAELYFICRFSKSRTENYLHFNSNLLFKYNAQSKDDGLILKDSIQSNVMNLMNCYSIAFAPRESPKVTLLSTVSMGLPLHIKLAVIV